MFAGLTFGLSSPGMDWLGGELRLFVWLVGLVLALWFGLRPFVNAFALSRIGKVALGIGYAVFMYLVLTGFALVAMCAHGCS